MAPMLFEVVVGDPAHKKMDVPVQAGKVLEHGCFPRATHRCENWILENDAEDERAGAAKAGGIFKERAVNKGNKMPSGYNASHLEGKLAAALAPASVSRIAGKADAKSILLYLDEERVHTLALHGGAGAASPKAGSAVQEPAVVEITGLSANYNVPRPQDECVMAFALHGGAGAAYLKAGSNEEPAVMEMRTTSAMCGWSHYDENVSAQSTVPILEEGVTTVMFDVPCRLTQEQLMDAMCDMGFADTFDFLYVPSVKKSNRGYAYVNFMSSDKAIAFGKVLPGYTFPIAKHSMKRFTVKAAHTQGKEANILRNIHSKVLPYIRDPPDFVLQTWIRDGTVM